jgi:hypothetical protein
MRDAGMVAQALVFPVPGRPPIRTEVGFIEFMRAPSQYLCLLNLFLGLSPEGILLSFL